MNLHNKLWRLVIFMSGTILLVAGCRGVGPKPLEDVQTAQATTPDTMPTTTVLLPGETPSTTPITDPDEAYLITPGRLAVRAGPGFEYGDPLTALSPNTTAAILGVSMDAGWWQIECPAEVLSPSGCWVRNDPLYADAYNSQGVPVVLSPPLYTPPSVPRVLNICLGAVPDSLYINNGQMLTRSNALEAIYDGPIDPLGYAFEPVILEKLPSLADGDARLEMVLVERGERVVDDAGSAVTLLEGMRVRPAGCRESTCAITFDGNSSIEMEQLVVTFRLLPRLLWSDGEPLTAEDSAYAYQLQKHPDTPVRKDIIERTASYQARDEVTTEWVGLPGYMDPTYYLNFFGPSPRHIWGEYTPGELLRVVDEKQLLIGWGPYVIEKVDNSTYDPWIRLHKNPLYFRAEEGLPRFNVLNILVTGQSTAGNVAMLLGGECHLVAQDASLDDWFDRLIEMDDAGVLKLHLAPGTAWEHIDFNIQPAPDIVNRGDFAGWDLDGDGLGPFGDVRLRQAVALCIDRKRAADEVYFGKSYLLDSYLPPEHPLYNPQIVQYAYDPEAGGALLDETGWQDQDGDGVREALGVRGVPEGTKLAFRLESTDATLRKTVTGILAESMAACGMQVELRYHPAAEWFADGPQGSLFGRRFDLGMFAWLSEPVPDCRYWMSEFIPGDPELRDAQGNTRHPHGWFGSDLRLPVNPSGYSSADFDQACRTAMGLLPGESAYLQSHQAVQAIFSRDVPIISLFNRIKMNASNECLLWPEMDATADSDTWNIEAYDTAWSCR